MSENEFHRAAVLLFDPVHVNLRTTRYALNEIGFKSVESCSTEEEFVRQLGEASWDLIVIDGSTPSPEVFQLVRRIRRGEVSPNPYAIIVLTTWIRDGAHVRRAIESGADDVIVRPFSTQFAEERVRTLVKDRKSFVITSDYVGPDRRAGNRGADSAESMKVPNTLKAKADGDEEQLREAYVGIREAKKKVEAERVRRVAMRLVVTAELQFDSKAGAAKEFDPADVLRSARDLRDQLERAGKFEAVQVAEALIDHCRTLKNPEERSVKNYRLIKELAIGTFAAYANGESIEKSKDEIANTVGALRKRMSGTASGGSAEDLPELKTASM